MSNINEILEKISEENIPDNDDDTEWNVRKIIRLWQRESKFHSPIDLDVNKAIPVTLPHLNWNHFETVPKRMKITNSGSTLIVSAKWCVERPYVTGSCLQGKYVLNQLHFHWGNTAEEGSEHSAEKIFYPMELHAVFFRAVYKSQAEAIKYSDGLLTMCYLCMFMSQDNPALNPILANISEIRINDTSASIEPFAISDLFFPFDSDYYLYCGNVTTDLCDTCMLWMISRQTMYVSFEQLRKFHMLFDSRLRPICQNFRKQYMHHKRHVFHVNRKYPITYTTVSLIPLFYTPVEDECTEAETGPIVQIK